MRNTFKSKDLEDKFRAYGYVLFDNFISAKEVEYLRNQYLSLKHDLGVGFHATMHSKSLEYREKVSEIISGVFTNKANICLDNYRHLVSNFTVKEPGKESFFDFHLDWNMVDETVCRSVTIWSPLEDTNEQNGNLWILESSSTLGNSYRCGPGLMLYFENPDELRIRRFKKRSLAMKAGDAIIYDHKLFHGSPANLSGKTRIALNQAMSPADFPIIHYVSDNKGNIEAREVDESFYSRCIINKDIGEGKLVKKFRLKSRPLEQNEVNKMIIL